MLPYSFEYGGGVSIRGSVTFVFFRQKHKLMGQYKIEDFGFGSITLFIH